MKKQFRRLKIFLFIICILSCAAFAGNQILLTRAYDQTVPEISFSEGTLSISTSAKESELLSGVTATDGKDGDVTKSIIIESISNLLNNDERVVTYAAFDADNHVGKASRTIRYTDYYSPEFSLTEPLVDSSSTSSNSSTTLTELLKPVTVKDCLDGDISDDIIMVNSYYGDNDNELYLNLQVTNSAGDVSEITVFVDEYRGNHTSQVTLTKYIVYVERGADFDEASYIDEAEYKNASVAKSAVTIDSDVDTTKAGEYFVKYTVTDDINNESAGVAVLTVVVME